MPDTAMEPITAEPEDLAGGDGAPFGLDETGRPIRPLWPAIRRGLMGRCPRCGTGPLFESFLRTHDHCAVCGQTFSHHRADDGPAYLTILIVGHLMAPILLTTYLAMDANPMVVFGVAGGAAVVLSLLLLPRLKGMLVAIQWAKYMHGFGEEVPAVPAGQMPHRMPPGHRPDAEAGDDAAPRDG